MWEKTRGGSLVLQWDGVRQEWEAAKKKNENGQLWRGLNCLSQVKLYMILHIYAHMPCLAKFPFYFVLISQIHLFHNGVVYLYMWTSKSIKYFLIDWLIYLMLTLPTFITIIEYEIYWTIVYTKIKGQVSFAHDIIIYIETNLIDTTHSYLYDNKYL